jgi:gluconate 2-dehydrogenase gamma chain
MEDAGARPSRGLSRGELVKRAGLLGAAAAVPAAGLAVAPVADASEQLTQLKALTTDQAATLEAVLERLIPTDSTGPGAKEANVLRYIDQSLAGDLSMFMGPYTDALRALDAYATAKQGAAFAQLSTDKQDAVLRDMDTNAATGFTPNAKAVFEMFRTHCVQGMFGDPAHGGNVNFVGWKLVRFPGPHFVVSAADQQLDVVRKTNYRSAYSYKLFQSTPRRP